MAEKRSTSKLLERVAETEKIHKIDRNTICAVTGVTADANELLRVARQHTQRHLYTYQSYPSIESTAVSICDLKQSYTQHGGLRPFGVAFLFAGWDKHHGFQLYSTDPAGNYASWKIKIIGQGSGEATRKLKESSLFIEKSAINKDGMDDPEDKPISSAAKLEKEYVMHTIDESLPECAKILASSLGVESLKAEGVEAAYLHFNKKTNELEYHILTTDELSTMVEKANALLENANKGDI
eukprot:UN02219